jgi:hypothetical protein
MYAEVRQVIFAALDQARQEELLDAELVRAALYNVLEEQGCPITDSVEGYIDILLEEFCPDYDVSRHESD